MTSTPLEGRRQRRARELRERIAAAAQAELAEHGVDAFSVERVAERADVAVQTVYNRAGRRDDLLLAAAARAVDHDAGYMDPAYRTGDGADTVAAAAAAYVTFALEHPAAFRLLAQPPGPPHEPPADDSTPQHQSSPPGPALPAVVADAVERQNAQLSAALRRAAVLGDARPVDPELAATALWAMLNGLLSLTWRADRLRVPAQAIQPLLDTALDLLAHGLATDQPPQAPHPERSRSGR